MVPAGLPASLKYIQILCCLTGNMSVKRRQRKSTTRGPPWLKDGSEGRAGMTHLQQHVQQRWSDRQGTSALDTDKRVCEQRGEPQAGQIRTAENTG